MKGRESISSESDEDYEIILAQKITKRTKQITQPPSEDGKPTVKPKMLAAHKNFYDKILRESDKFKEDEQCLAPEQKSPISEYNPRLVIGSIRNYSECTSADLQNYKIDSGRCAQFDISDEIKVIIVGRTNIVFQDGMNMGLYLPQLIFNAIWEKKTNVLPPGMIQIDKKKYGVIVKRELTNGSTNILDYPYLILEPGHMLYPTYLCNWIQCKRRISIVNYFQGEKAVSQPMVYGNTCHRLMEWFTAKVITLEDYLLNQRQTIKKLYDSMLYDMYLVDSSFERFSQTCQNSLKNIANFYGKYIIKQQEIQINKYQKTFLKIQKIVGSQVMFISKFFGLKGKVDVLLFGKIIDRKKNTEQPVYIPMELKTGKKTSDSHKKQTDIYNILVRQQYNRPVLGLLYYSQPNTIIFRQQDPLVSYQITVIHRNQIVNNIMNLYRDGNINLPAFAPTFNQCKYCQPSSICQTLSISKSQNNTNAKNKDNSSQSSTANSLQDIEDTPGMYVAEIKESVKGFTTMQLLYFRNWMRMIHLQQLQSRKINKSHNNIGIYNFTLPFSQLMNVNPVVSNELIKVRMMISHMCRNQQEVEVFQDFYKVSHKLRIFIKSIQLIQGCKVVATHRKGNTFSMLIQMNNYEIEFSSKRLTYYYSTQQENNEDHKVQIQTFQNQFFSTMRKTIFSLISKGQPWLKSIVINQQPVKQQQQNTEKEKNTQDKKKKQDKKDTEKDTTINQHNLNPNQQQAFSKCLSANRFCLIKGMPGTGKTQLIIRLIEQFGMRKKTVLVTTFTNRSLDNILQRLIKSGKLSTKEVIREGTQYSSQSKILNISARNIKFTSVEEYKQFYGMKRIWFVTLSSLFIHHLPRHFDVVILDEASQCLEPVCLDAILRADKFIMIGDYQQLQPLVKSSSAGMKTSLFERLCKAYFHNTVSLTKQYRMNAQILSICNSLVYNNELKPAAQEVENQRISLIQDWKQTTPQSFQSIIDPQHSVVFIDYDPLFNSLDKNMKGKEINIKKMIGVELCAFIFKKFIEFGVDRKKISIITAYNACVDRLIRLLKESSLIPDNYGHVLTIDKSQGIDKDVIILLISKGNDDLIQNPRRLNVALTRAKCKLIIIGSETHLEKMNVWEGDLAKILRRFRKDLSRNMIESFMKEFTSQQFIQMQ